MTDAAIDSAHGGQEGHHDVKPVRKAAMWVFLGSEFVFFGAMIATFLLYRNTTNGGPGTEIFDIQMLPGPRWPTVIGFRDDTLGSIMVAPPDVWRPGAELPAPPP